jgi:hypothetical protein
MPDLAKIIDLFDGAVERGLKWPKITFDASEVGVPLVMSRAGAQAAAPYTVNLTDGGRYPDATWYGRIRRDGSFMEGRDCPRERLLPFLELLAAGTADVASMYGKRTGNCCFCGKDLTDQRSVSVGYGPVCAGKWGLPWGVDQGAVA